MTLLFNRKLICLATAGACLIPQLVGAEPEPSANQPQAVLEEVYVTARRRVENLQETPVAVSAMSGEDLREAGLAQTEELSAVVPSLHIQKGASNQIYIRGIGERTGYARVDPTVGIYLDDVYLPRTDGQLLGLLDVQSVQVLRGPQGTLFGKNTTGGAIVFDLIKPNDVPSAYVEGGLGNYKESQLKAAANVPVTDNLYTRILVNARKNEGYMKDAHTGERFNSIDQQALIAQLRWDASDRWVVDLLGYLGKVRENLPGNNCKINNPDALLVNGLGLMWPGDTDATDPHAYRDNCGSNSQEELGDLRVDLGAEPYYDKDMDTELVGLTLSWEATDTLMIKTVLGYREEVKGPALKSDNDGGAENWSEAIQIGDSVGRSLSGELQLNWALWNDRLNVNMGLFYMSETNQETSLLTANLVGIDGAALAQLALGQQPDTPAANGQPFVGQLLGDPLIISGFDLDNTTKATYFQAVLDANESWQFTLGMRYTEEERDSALDIQTSDPDAIAQRLILSGRFGPGSDGLHPFLGTWAEDPVRIAQNLFPDADGDGIPDFPMRAGFLQRDQRAITFTEFTPMLSASYQLSDNLLEGSAVNSAMIYLTWSNGFKAGFAEPLLTDGLQVVEPETVENRELGFKVDLFNQALRINAAVYSMVFENMQLNTVSTDSQNNLAVTHQNAGESAIEGGEIEVTWIPASGLVLALNYSNNNYKFTEFAETDLLTLALTGERVLVDRSDENFPLSPEESGFFSVQYEFVSSVGSFTPRLEASYKSDIFHGLDRASWVVSRDDPSLSHSESYTLWNARFSWTNRDADLTVTAFVKNLSDERYIFGTSVADSLGTFNQITGSPRTYGVQFIKRFEG